MDRVFPIIYHIKHVEKGVAAADVPKGYGFADSLFVASSTDNEDDPTKRHFSFLGLDGRGAASMTPDELYEIWIMMAHMMTENTFFDPEDPRAMVLKTALDSNLRFTSSSVEEPEPEPPKLTVS